MKKTAIISALCILALTGCGRVDSVDVDSDIKPFEIETSDNEDEDDPEDGTEKKDPSVTTAVSTGTKGTTTTRTGAISIVKRSGTVAVSKKPSTSTNNRPTTPSAAKPNTPQKPASASTTAAAPKPSAATTTTAKATAPPATTVVTTIPDAENPAVVTRDDLTCRVLDDGIHITSKGEPVQIISVDTSYMLGAYKDGVSDDSALVNICDFDFDGSYDLFIPSSKDDYNTYGTYYHYDPSSETFEEWTELSSIGQAVSSDINSKTVTVNHQTNDIEYERKTYQWVTIDEETGKLALSIINFTKQYRLDSSPDNEYEIYIDHYEYPSGTETLIKREKHLYDDNKNFLGVEEIPIG